MTDSGRDRAIEAAARAMYLATGDAATDCDEWMTCQRDAVAALDAALPVLLNDLADSIEAERMGDEIDDWNVALIKAAEIVRAAAAGWGEA
jgi:hypothetical protein